MRRLLDFRGRTSGSSPLSHFAFRNAPSFHGSGTVTSLDGSKSGVRGGSIWRSDAMRGVVARYDPTPKHAMKAFTAPLKEIEDLRNMWEHEIDYL